MITEQYHITELLVDMDRDSMRKLRDWLSYQLGDTEVIPEWNIGGTIKTVESVVYTETENGVTVERYNNL